MSGYRSLHRQEVSPGIPIWQVQTLSLTKDTRMIWTACANGTVQGWVVHEKDAAVESDLLDASAMQLTSICTLGTPSKLGCTQVSLIRNYTGEDDLAGDVVVASLDIAARMRVWSIDPKDLEAAASQSTNNLKPLFEFIVQDATGTTMALCSPRNNGPFHQSVVLAAVGCLDGSVVLTSTGLATPNSKKDAPACGTVLQQVGGSGSAIPTRLVWHPSTPQLLGVGRQDGTVDLFLEAKRWHRLLRHTQPIRGLAFSKDGLVVSGCDDGMVCVWDVNRKAASLVHHLLNAHEGWVLDLCMLQDNKRFVSVGSDGQVRIWSLSGQGSYTPLHSFSTEEQTAWTISSASDNKRLVAGTEQGWIQVFSLE